MRRAYALHVYCCVWTPSGSNSGRRISDTRQQGVAMPMNDDVSEEVPTTRRTPTRTSIRSTLEPPNALRTLDQARLLHDGIAILQSNGGGQTYVVCPAVLVRCWEPVLKLLLRDLDAIVYPGSPQVARIRYERLEPGTTILGGGEVIAGVWIHGCFVELGLDRSIRGVLKGRLGRLPFRDRLRHAVRNGIKQVQRL